MRIFYSDLDGHEIVRGVLMHKLKAEHIVGVTKAGKYRDFVASVVKVESAAGIRYYRFNFSPAEWDQMAIAKDQYGLIGSFDEVFIDGDDIDPEDERVIVYSRFHRDKRTTGELINPRFAGFRRDEHYFKVGANGVRQYWMCGGFPRVKDLKEKVLTGPLPTFVQEPDDRDFHYE